MTAEEYARKADLDGFGKRVNDVEGEMRIVKYEISELKNDTSCLPAISTTLALQQQTLSSLSRNINRLIWLLVGTLITGIGALIFDFIRRGA